jgi:PAS domain S-box-containing protein
MKVLYVGDNSFEGNSTYGQLTRFAPDISLDFAAAWTQAAHLLEAAAANGGPYDIVLTDLEPEARAGLALVAELRSRSAAPVVVITGLNDKDGAVAALKAGADDYLARSEGYLSRLPHVLRNVVERRAILSEGLFRPLRVLYAEHDATDADLTVRHAARHAPYLHFDLAASARDVVERTAGPAAGGYDTLLLDYRLPDRSGLELLKDLRDEGVDLPVVVVSGPGDEEVAVQAFKLGASDCIIKTPGYLFRLPSALESVFHRAQLIREKAALRESEQRFRTLFDSVPVAILTRDPDGRCLSANARAAQLWDRSPLGKTLQELLPPELAAQWKAGDEQVILSGEENVVEETVPTPTGPRLFLTRRTPMHDRAGRVTGILSSSLDITERKSLEAQLLQSQKMEAIGRLAGGVAHDFNNLLTVINGCASFLISSMPEDSEATELSQQILDAGERAAALTRQLLAFSRRQVLEPRNIDLNAVVAGMERLLERVIGEDISLETSMDPRLREVLADPIQVEQVIMNFAVNARDAMPRGGTLRISTANVTVAVAGSDFHPVPPGEYVRLAAADSGVGMDPDTLAHIFEPFFTTKALDKGTGLGLSTVYGIVKQSGGHIRVGSEPGGGTVFEVFLPVAAGPVVPAHEAANDAPRRVTTGTILVVEDEDMVRKLICSVLSRQAHSVIEVKDPDAAVRICEEDPRTIDLMITDVVMPGTSGVDLASRVCSARPSMRVLYISGYPYEAAGFDKLHGQRPAFLSKPFPPKVLAQRVQDLLSERKAG